MIDVTQELFDDLLSLPDGLFTRREALEFGVRDRVLAAGLRRGLLTRVVRGVYTARDTWASGDHRWLVARAALRRYPDAALVGATAVAAHGIPVLSVPVFPGDIARPVAREVWTAELRVRPLRHEVVSTAWGPATSLPASLLQLTMDWGIRPGVASIDAALHEGAVTMDELVDEHAKVLLWPRSSRVRCALAWADGRSESLGESLTRVILRAAGLEVEAQIPIADRDGVVFARVDLGIVGTPVLIEFDGKVKYTDGGPDALFREKKREDRIRARGYIVIRVTWADLHHPERIVDAVRRAMRAVA